VLKGKFASSVFQSCKENTPPKTRKFVSGPQCVKLLAAAAAAVVAMVMAAAAAAGDVV
jgi:hypothetical protein